jgi:hypothetical protein
MKILTAGQNFIKNLLQSLAFKYAIQKMEKAIL